MNGRVLDPQSGRDETGHVLIEDDRIAAVGPNIFPKGAPDRTEVVDIAGFCISPGLIDMHAVIGEPGAEHKESFESAGRRRAGRRRHNTLHHAEHRSGDRQCRPGRIRAAPRQ
ncbi:MAG: hypothetical protein ACMVY4_02150 [Minwuia sp.]|uniref:hypothetical protein n=1 Tax=Minwuia sp. TaxID=2493630 RepID=UPI003A879F20